MSLCCLGWRFLRWPRHLSRNLWAWPWRLGADVEKADSWGRVHNHRPELAARHGALSLLAGGLLGIGVLWAQQQFWLIAIAMPLVGLGYLYNAGPKPLSYTHLGEWVTGICYGPGVFGCLWLVAGLPPGIGMIAGSIGFGALAMSLLLSHQPPQIETDSQAGKRCFAVRYGVKRTILVSRSLFWLFLLSLSFSLLTSLPILAGVLMAIVAILLAIRVTKIPVNPKAILLSATAYVMLALTASHLSV